MFPSDAPRCARFVEIQQLNEARPHSWELISVQSCQDWRQL